MLELTLAILLALFVRRLAIVLVPMAFWALAFRGGSPHGDPLMRRDSRMFGRYVEGAPLPLGLRILIRLVGRP